jgi:F0F1-type ATP synthase delta subunit
MPITSTTELVFALEREYAAALAQVAIYGAQSSHWVDRLTVAKSQASLASLNAYAESLDQALQTARAKLPTSCRKPESH